MTEPFVRPDVRNFLDMLKANPRPVMNNDTIAAMRPMAAAGFAMIDAPVGEIAVSKDITIAGPGGPLALRLIDTRADRGPGPVAVFCHGGGYVIGDLDTHMAMCAEIARQLDLPVVAVDYRLAPENPFPAAVDDGEAAARWVAESPAELGLEVTGLVLCGDSAGGNLTIVSALALRDRPAAVPVLLQFPIYPAVDPGTKYPSGKQFSDGYGLDSADMGWYFEALKPDTDHWRGRPILADLAGIAPMLMLTAGLDPLRDQGRAYAARAIEAGVTVTYREAPGLIHGFAGYRRAIPSANKDFVEALAVARQMLRESMEAHGLA